ncbi:hypothetical protein [Paenibacillus agricola]|uniref:Uncharacterized protein n=1 Tax=Paenibacillus agricola TaxID=2716264 RepID=A0ABX0JJE5_9BACL|nr:hypothetical protein [Paenibacillus agricola]NHN34629.1 hypothetical protein [Paenibacillus agricola]
MTNEIFDNAISLSRLLWIMGDDPFNRLLAITQDLLRLAKEHGDFVLPERRQAIRAEMERLRVERSEILGVLFFVNKWDNDKPPNGDPQQK